MQNLMSYSGLTTKLRAMQSRFLTEENFRQILELDDVPAVISYLKQTESYSPVLSSLDETHLKLPEAEPFLRRGVFYDYAKIYSFANAEQKEFLRTYFMRYDVMFLKACLRRLMDPQMEPVNMTRYEEYYLHCTKLPAAVLASAASPDEFLEALNGSVYYKPLAVLRNSDHTSLFDYEMALDLLQFRTFWKVRKKIVGKNDLEEITRILGTKFDMLNMQWIFRCKKYYRMPNADIYAMIIPVYYHLKEDDIRDMIEAENLDILSSLFALTYYGKHFPDEEKTSLEVKYVHILGSILKKEARMHPYSPAMIYSYLYQKEHEVDRLIIAAECVRYGVPVEEALVRLASR